MKRFLISALIWILASSAAWSNPQGTYRWIAPNPSVTCTEGNAFIARTSGLDTAHKNNYQNLICGLVADGIWSKLDALYAFATQDSTTANLNLKSVSFTISPVGSPAWVADRGYSGIEGSTTVHLDTLFSISGTQFTTNDAHISAWSNSNIQTVGTVLGSRGGFGGEGVVFIIPRDGSNLATLVINSLTGSTASNTNGLGFYVVNIASGTTQTGYRNGVVFAGPTTVTASATWGGPFFYLASNAFPGAICCGSGNQISGGSIGGALTGTDQTNLYNRFRIYMTAVGVP